MTPFLPLPFLVYCLVCLLFLLFLCLFKKKNGSCFFCLFCFWLFGVFFLLWILFGCFSSSFISFFKGCSFFLPFFWGGGGVGGGARFVFIWVFPPSVAWSFLPSFLRFSFCLFVVYFWIFSFLSFFFLCFFVYVGCPFFFIFLQLFFFVVDFFLLFVFVFCWVSICFCFCLSFMFLVRLRLVFLWERIGFFILCFVFWNHLQADLWHLATRTCGAWRYRYRGHWRLCARHLFTRSRVYAQEWHRKDIHSHIHSQPTMHTPETKSKTLNSPNMTPSFSCLLPVQCDGGRRPGSLAEAPQHCSNVGGLLA